MTPLPSWVDYELAEQAAAVMTRSLSGTTAAWGELLATAQTVLARRLDTIDAEPTASYGFDDWRDIVCASRILDLAGTDKGLADRGNRQSAAILAACAFGMSGAFVSAKAVIDSHGLLNADLSPGELVALVISCPTFSRETFLRFRVGTPYRECLEAIVDFLATGVDRAFDDAKGALDRAIEDNPSGWEAYLLELSRFSLAHLGRLSAAKVLRAIC